MIMEKFEDTMEMVKNMGRFEVSAKLKGLSDEWNRFLSAKAVDFSYDRNLCRGLGVNYASPDRIDMDKLKIYAGMIYGIWGV
jgi:hypothetical protein